MNAEQKTEELKNIMAAYNILRHDREHPALNHLRETELKAFAEYFRIWQLQKEQEK